MNAFDTPFKHRVLASGEGKFYNPHDAINPSLERAKALTDLMEVVFELVKDDCNFEPNTFWRAAQAIRLEIMDAQTLLEAYIEAEEGDKTEVQS